MNDKLRPITLNDYIGQDNIKNNLKVYIDSAQLRKDSLDHILLYGPPGLGKTTLANIISKELNTNIKVINGPSIEKQADLAAILCSLNKFDVLFIDEIHRIPNFIEEILYSALEDFKLNIIVGDENTKRNLNIDLEKFTLIGATTKIGNISLPLRDRFSIIFKFDYYENKDLVNIIKRTAKLFKLEINDNATLLIAKRSRGTPRIANNLLKRIRDFSIVNKNKIINEEIVINSLKNIGIDEIGLNNLDLEYLNCLINIYNNGPIGINALSKSLNEENTTIEEVIEPYLLQIGFINLTKRGRIATKKAINYMQTKY